MEYYGSMIRYHRTPVPFFEEDPMVFPVAGSPDLE
jgi:hypothetical protein